MSTATSTQDQEQQEGRSGQLHLLFIRHGETKDNIDRILQGQRDTELTDKGHQEARTLAKQLKSESIDIIYHSPLKRMRQTIQPILDDRRNVPTQADADLMGQALGVLEGKSYDDINMGDPRSADGTEGVELFDDFVRRLKDALGRIIGVQASKMIAAAKDRSNSGGGRRDRTVAIATHGVGITSLLKTLEATPHCDGFNPAVAVRGPDAYEVRWTDSDDVARLIVPSPTDLPIRDGLLDWSVITGKPFVIEYWGKKEKAL